MQTYPAIKNGEFGWRRLEGDYIPQKQIWMVIDEESDLFAKNSSLKDSETAQGVDSFGNNFSEENKKMSSPVNKNNFFGDKVNKEFNKLPSIYDFHSEDSESDGNEDRIFSQKTYSRKSRYSQIVMRNSIWNSSNDKYEKETNIAIEKSQSKLKSRENLKLVYPKPNNYMFDITNKTLKDEKNRRNSIKRKLFNPSGDLENNEDQGHRSSSRRRKIVNYCEIQGECSSEISSDNESESEDEDESEDVSEDENGNKVKKKVESPTIVKKSQLSEYEQMVERNKEENRRMLEEMGIIHAKSDLVESKIRIKKGNIGKTKEKHAPGINEIRRSQRLKNTSTGQLGAKLKYF